MTRFLEEVGKGGHARILRELQKLAHLGFQYRGDSKPLGGGLFELRIAHDRMAYRLIYVLHQGSPTFLVAFVKKSQKTPADKINLAKSRQSQLIDLEAPLVTLNSIDLSIGTKLHDPEFRREWFRSELEGSVPEQFRDLRERRGLTQAELAENTDMKQSAISRFESSTDAKWKLETLLRLADALDARLSIHLTPAEEIIAEQSRAAPNSETELSPIQSRLEVYASCLWNDNSSPRGTARWDEASILRFKRNIASAIQASWAGSPADFNVPIAHASSGRFRSKVDKTAGARPWN